MTDWDQISKTPGLSEEYIRNNAGELDWDWVSIYQTLSEEFIREFADKLDWYYIPKYQTLSEEFIREFADRVYWYWILRKQAISEEFVLQHLSYFLEDKWIWRDLPDWCSKKGWNLERLLEAREMVRLLL